MSQTPVDEFVRSELPRYGRVPRDLLRDPSISDRAIRVYGLLDDYAGAESRPFPKRSTLAGACGCSLASIDRVLRELQETGWIKRVSRYRPDGGQSSNLYVLMATPLVTGDDPPSSRVTTQEGEPDEDQPPPPPEPGGDTPALIDLASVSGIGDTGNMNSPATRTRQPREVRDGDPSWDAFWEAYPRKSGKGAARKAWPKALAKVAGPEVLIDAAVAFAAQVKKDGRDEQFTPHPATWLNQERWSDQVEKPRSTGRGMPKAGSSEECPDHVGEWADNCRVHAADRLVGD